MNNELPDRRSIPHEVGGTLAAWITGQLKVSAILAIVYTAGFAVAGVPWWFAVGPICGFLNLVPVFGPVIALVLAAGIAYLGTYDIYPTLGALLTFVIAQALEGFYLTPTIIGRRLRLPPFVVFIAVLLGGALFGIVGILFAAPALAVVAVLWRRMRPAR